jgi:diguanylate cyclase (GGDEF)-like protein/PAS domain S-box-containing protein
LALALCGLVLALRYVLAAPGDAVGLLLLVPVVLVAVEFGWWGGLVAGEVGAALNVVSVLMVDAPISAVGYLNRGIVFVLVGGVVGRAVAQRARVEQESDRVAKESARWLEMSNDMIATASLDGYFTQVNPAWERCLGYSAAEMMDRPYMEFIHPEDLDSTIAAASSLADGPSEIVGFENRYRTKDGRWRWLLWSSCSDGEQVYAMAKDITDRKRDERHREQLLTEEQILARTDRLTGVPNRLAWDEELENHLVGAGSHPHALGVLLLDLDGFKQFNDQRGHQAGDALLKGAGANWHDAIRDTDYLARIGGDEFALLLPNCPPERGAQVTERLQAATPRGQGCSVGIAFWDGNETADELIARADRALYANKRARLGETPAEL